MSELENIFDMDSYEDAIQHILEFHGEKGREVVNNPNEAPTMWHECAHVGFIEDIPADYDWGHTHKDTTPESVEARMEQNLKLFNDPNFLKLLMEQLSDENSPLVKILLEEDNRLNGEQ